MFGHKAQNQKNDDMTPETAYNRAQQEYDKRSGTAKAAAANWRLIAFCLCFITLISNGAAYYFANRSVIVPYIVEVDARTGAVISSSKVYDRSTANQKEIEYFSWQVIKKSRTLPKDVIVYETNWNDVYTFLDSASSQKFNDMAIREDHRGKLALGITTMLNLQQITPVSGNDNTFNVRWNEVTYNADGSKAGEYSLEAYLTVQQLSPTEKDINVNPLGLKIKDFNISKVQQ